MSESDDPDRVEQWDDVVDVICVGSTPGVLAYRNVCVEADLEVLHLAAPPGFDDETLAYVAAMTEDLDQVSGEAEPVVTRAVPAPLRRDARGRPDTLDAFFGEELREWSARCAGSPFAVMFTQVPDQFVRMRSEDGEIITVVMIPGQHGISSPTETFTGLLYEDGRLAGALVSDGSVSRRIRADAGLALPVGPGGQWPQHDCLALVGRPAGRFARLEILESDE